jgi:hypothetical protein
VIDYFETFLMTVLLKLALDFTFDPCNYSACIIMKLPHEIKGTQKGVC